MGEFITIEFPDGQVNKYTRLREDEDMKLSPKASKKFEETYFPDGLSKVAFRIKLDPATRMRLKLREKIMKMVDRL